MSEKENQAPASVENEVVRETRAAKERAEGAKRSNKATMLKAGAAVGVGGAAIAAALLFARRSRKD